MLNLLLNKKRYACFFEFYFIISDINTFNKQNKKMTIHTTYYIDHDMSTQNIKINIKHSVNATTLTEYKH